MALSGIAMASLTDLPSILFGDAGVPLPKTFDDFVPRKVHGVAAKVIIGLVSLHLLGALYHRVLRKDGLLRRMWFGRR
jgi:cytochrome b561